MGEVPKIGPICAPDSVACRQRVGDMVIAHETKKRRHSHSHGHGHEHGHGTAIGTPIIAWW